MDLHPLSLYHHCSIMVEEHDLGDPQKVAEACGILGIDTTGKTYQQIQTECWKTIAFKNAEYVDRLLKTTSQYESMVDRLVLLLEKKEQAYQEQALSYARQLMELIKQSIRATTNLRVDSMS